jgi:hypothetical protein
MSTAQSVTITLSSGTKVTLADAAPKTAGNFTDVNAQNMAIATWFQATLDYEARIRKIKDATLNDSALLETARDLPDYLDGSTQGVPNTQHLDPYAPAVAFTNQTPIAYPAYKLGLCSAGQLGVGVYAGAVTASAWRQTDVTNILPVPSNYPGSTTSLLVGQFYARADGSVFYFGLNAKGGRSEFTALNADGTPTSKGGLPSGGLFTLGYGTSTQKGADIAQAWKDALPTRVDVLTQQSESKAVFMQTEMALFDKFLNLTTNTIDKKFSVAENMARNVAG